MSFSDLAILKKLSVGILTVTVIFAVLLGLAVFVPIFLQKPDVPVLQSLARGPSSIRMEPSALNSILPGPPKVETVNLNCLDRKHPVQWVSAAKFVRILARVCDHNAAANSRAIVNRANGFEATIFNLERSQLTTDYIQLSPGRNQITYDFDLAGGGFSGEVWVEYSTEPNLQ